MNIIQAIILAIVEGLTEFLPISSTGHMVIVGSLLGIEPTPFVKFFTVAIQLGAIMSVVVLYFKKFFKSINFYLKLAVGVVPALIFGALLGDKIDAMLENPIGVATALFLGGFVLLFIEKLFKNPDPEKTSENLSFMDALVIGTFQCIALFPGVSRSAATIIGGLQRKLSLKMAAEFSFFLAVPTMAAATLKKCYDFYKTGTQISGEEIKLLAIGNVVAFIVAILAIKTFIGILNKSGFKIFGVYRIIVGGIILALYFAGYQLKIF